MTKKDFEAIASIVRDSRDRFSSNTAHAMFAENLSEPLAESNPRFDRGRFIMACMPAFMVGTSKANVWERIAGAGAG